MHACLRVCDRSHRRPTDLLRCSSFRAGCLPARRASYPCAASSVRLQAIGPRGGAPASAHRGRLEGHTDTMKLRKSIVTLAVMAGAAAFAAPAGAAATHHSTVYRGDVETPGNLQAIAQCESGGDPTAIGGGGSFRGKYQFMQSTWDNVAPEGYAG